MAAENYLRELMDEKSRLDPRSLQHSLRLVEGEINRVRSETRVQAPVPYQQERRPTYQEKVEKLIEKIMLPVEEHPKFNFVGKLIGPKGNTLKAIQSCTQTKISVLGKGSTRDRKKEEELLKTGEPKYEHFNEPLHVKVQIDAPKSEAHDRLANVFEEINKCLTAENPEVSQSMPYIDDRMGGKFAAVGRGVPMVRIGIPPPGALVINEQAMRGAARGGRGGGRGAGRGFGGSRGKPY